MQFRKPLETLDPIVNAIEEKIKSEERGRDMIQKENATSEESPLRDAR